MQKKTKDTYNMANEKYNKIEEISSLVSVVTINVNIKHIKSIRFDLNFFSFAFTKTILEMTQVENKGMQHNTLGKYQPKEKW